MKHLVLVCLLGAALAATEVTDEKTSKAKQCNQVKSFDKGGVSEQFAKHVSHAVHSLTIEDIRMYFEKNVGEDNSIPVVNPLLRDPTRVLENAPFIGYDNEFETDGMKHFDVIMKGVNMAGWKLSSFDLLERLSHVYHMSEIWAAAGKEYTKVAKTLDVDSDLCDCVRDTENNGLAKYLQLTAFQVRYPGITSGNTTITDTYLGGFLDYHISYGLQERPKNIVDELMNFDFSGTDAELIPGVVEKLIDESSYEEHDEEEEMENSKEHWEWCVGELKKLLSPELIHDTAVFMRCQLKPSEGYTFGSAVRSIPTWPIVAAAIWWLLRE